MRKILLILLFIIPVVSFSQNEYKITTESAIRQEYSGSEAVVTAFVTITNIGNQDNWYDNFSGFVLQSKNTREIYKLIDARNILEDEINPNGMISASLSFLVPKTADSLYLKYPLRYGGKETFLFRSYNLSKNDNESETYVGESGIVLTTGQKPENKEGNNNSKGKTDRELVAGIDGLANLITGGIGFMKSSIGNKYNLSYQGFFLTLKPFIYKFKKNNLALILDLEWGGGGSSIVGNDNNQSDTYLNFYGLDNKKYLAEPSHNSIFIYYSVYAGPGLSYYKYKYFTPYCSFKIGYNYLTQNDGKLYNIENGQKILIMNNNSLSGLGFKYDMGIYFAKILCFSYQFNYFYAASRNSILNSNYIGHFLNLSVGGY